MAENDSTPKSVFDDQCILRIVELMKDHDLREVDLQQEGQRIRIKRGTAAAGYPSPLPGYPPPQPVAAPPTAAAQPAPPAPAATAADSSDSDQLVVITSPMVGTFYSRPNPKAAPYVKVGDHVDPESTICIIEAMKVFNEIPAEMSGRIVAILADDEEPVEFGKPLFKVDPRG